jgi:UDP-N-acetylglucosamine--N-acetylmuramyl-(pentapeptide) pyrophosphoryl-undecaprenol N-acetylglucosamine transferase
VNVFFAGGGTGGHLYPALAIARALVRADARVTPFFIGARRGIEREVLPQTEFPFELLELHPLYRRQPWRNWRTVVGGAGALWRLRTLGRTLRPAAVVATGGYAAGAALQHAKRYRVPTIIQDQNSFPGATVRWFARSACQIHLGFPEAAAALHPGADTRVFISGNPIEPPPEPRPTRADADALWSFPQSFEKTLLVFGGSQGAAAINRVVGAWIEAHGPTRSGVRVIWSTGAASYDTYKALESDVVRVRPYIAPMAHAYAAADLALARAGAMSTAELAAWGIPAILVPLPTAAADHQTANARAIADAGAAVCVPQSSLTVDALAAAVTHMASDDAMHARMRAAALARARPHAAADIAAHILTVLEPAAVQ